MFVERSEESEPQVLRIIPARKATPYEQSTYAINLRKGAKISQETRDLHEKRDKSLDADPETRPLPPEVWANAMNRGEFFRPLKQIITVRVEGLSDSP